MQVKNLTRWMFLLFVNVVLLTGMFTVTTSAYVDPSSITYVIQAVAAVLIAMGAFLTIFRHKIFAAFRKDKSDKKRRMINLTEDDKETDKSEKKSTTSEISKDKDSL